VRRLQGLKRKPTSATPAGGGDWTGKKPGQTLGKKALGIRVRNVEQDRAIGYGSSAGRYFITVAFGIFYVPLLLDYLWPLWDKQHQAFHDKVASSIVVRV